MQLRADFIVGKQTNNTWSGVYGFKPDDSIEPLELFAIIKLATATEESGLEPLAKMFLDELQNYLFVDGKEGDYIIRLENAVWKMKSKMEALLSSDQRYSQSGLDIEIGLTLFDRNFLYIGVVGESKIFIKRGDRFVELSSGLSDGNMLGFLKTGSMELEPGDRLVLSTSSAVEVGKGSIESAISNLNIDNLSSFSSLEGVGVLLLADENDSWVERDSQIEQITEDSIDKEESVVTEKSSAKYIPVQEEDFEDTAEDYESTETNKVEQVETVDEDVQSLGGNLNTNLEDAVDEKSIPQGRVLAGKLKDNFVKGIKFGSNKLKSIKNNFQSRKLSSETESETVEGVREQENFASNTAPMLHNLKGVFGKVQLFFKSKIVPFFQKSNKTYIKYFRDFVIFVGNLIKKLIKWFKKEFIGGGVDDRRDIFAKARRRKRNRIILVVLTIVLVIFIVNTINNRNAQLAEQARVEKIRASVNDYKSQLDSLVRQSASNLDDAKKTSLVEQLDKLNTSLESQKRDGLYIDEINSQQETIVKTKDKITGAVGFTQTQLIADLGKLYSDANLTDIVYTQGNLYVSDKERNTIYQMPTNINSEVKQFATGLNAPSTLTTNVDGDIIFFDADGASAMGKISVGNGEVKRFPSLSPAVIGTITKAAVFSGNDALYEIHQNHQQIYKRDKNGDTYASGGAVYNTQNPPNWKTDPELGSAIDIDVPYEIYILVRGKGLRRYLGGENNTISQATFLNTTKKDFDSLSSATAIDIDGKLLAVADPTNRRVMLFTIQDNDEKSLAYTKSFVYRGSDTSVFRNIKELVINETNNNIFVLDGTAIIRLDI
jgi:hypothetical protein